jgi:hypothetical protein
LALVGLVACLLSIGVAGITQFRLLQLRSEVVGAPVSWMLAVASGTVLATAVATMLLILSGDKFLYS